MTPFKLKEKLHRYKQLNIVGNCKYVLLGNTVH